MPDMATVMATDVDVDRLRSDRDLLVFGFDHGGKLDGLVALLDALLDSAEGYHPCCTAPMDMGHMSGCPRNLENQVGLPGDWVCPDCGRINAAYTGSGEAYCFECLENVGGTDTDTPYLLPPDPED